MISGIVAYTEELPEDFDKAVVVLQEGELEKLLQDLINPLVGEFKVAKVVRDLDKVHIYLQR